MVVELHIVSPAELDDFERQGVQIYRHPADELPIDSILAKEIADSRSGESDFVESDSSDADDPPRRKRPHPPFYRALNLPEGRVATELVDALDSDDLEAPRLGIQTKLTDSSFDLNEVIDRIANFKRLRRGHRHLGS